MKQLSLGLLLLIAVTSTYAQTGASERSKEPMVFINGSRNVSITGTAVGTRVFSAQGASVSKHDQTMEMAQQLLKSCPEVTLTLRESDPAPDYALLLNRDGGHGFFDSGISQFVLVRGSDQTILYANKKGTVAKAVKDGCKAILADWHQQNTAAAKSTLPPPTTPKPPNPSADWWNKGKP
jgi:hypothetical protein